MMQKISGFYFVSGTSKKQEAFLLFDDKGFLTVTHRDGRQLAGPESLKQVSIASRLGNTPRIVRFPGDGIFETSDNDGVDACLKKIRPYHALLHILESRLRYVVIAFLATIIFVWASIQHGIPALAERVALAIPPESNRMIGQGALELLDKWYVDVSALPTKRQEELRGKFFSLISDADNIPVRVEFRDAKDSFGANAFALPDGMVVFTDQLVGLAESDDELIGVYAHEIGHIVRRHSMRNILQSSALAVVLVAVTGDISSVPALVTAAPTLIVRSGYSRDFEREADRFAIQQLLRHNMNPMLLGEILMRMEKTRLCVEGEAEGSEGCQTGRESWMDYLSTHPGTDERMRLIQEEMSAYRRTASP